MKQAKDNEIQAWHITAHVPHIDVVLSAPFSHQQNATPWSKIFTHKTSPNINVKTLDYTS